jgi:hypothetical protein
MMSQWLDVHGAGAQRSDQKGGDFTGCTYEPDGYYFPMAPQGDATRIDNYVRCVRTPQQAAPTIDRYDSLAALQLGTPDRSFAEPLPWWDPDNVLDAGAPPTLFYQVSPTSRIGLLKDDLTVRMLEF